MKPDRPRYFYIFSMFLTIFTLLSSSLYASNDEDEQERNTFIPQRGENESPFILTLRTMTDRRDSVRPVENSLQIMRTGLDRVISTQLIPIEEISSVKDTVRETKDKTIRSQSTLREIKRDLETPIQPLNKSSNLARLKTLGDLDGFLAGMGLYINWGMNEGDIKTQVHAKLTQSPPTFSVGYSGSTYYSGYAPYSGNTSYSGSVGAGYWTWICQSCRYENAARNGKTVRYCTDCKGSQSSVAPKTSSGHILSDSPSVSYSGNTSYSGSEYYSGNTSYSGNVNTTCSQDHHNCACDKWSSIVLSFREMLEEKDYYKSTSETQKSVLQNIDRKHQEVSENLEEMAPRIEIIQEKSQLAISTIQGDRGLFINGFEDIKEKTAFTFSVLIQLQESEKAFQEQLLKIAKSNEEEQKSEKIRLQQEIERKEESKNLEIQNIMSQQKIINQSIVEDSKDKEKRLLEKDTQILDLIHKKHAIDLEHMKKESSLSQAVKEKEFEQVLIQKNMEKEQEILALRMRSLIPNLFMKLCAKSGVDEKRVDGYIEVLMDENMAVAQMLKKVEFFIMKEKL